MLRNDNYQKFFEDINDFSNLVKTSGQSKKSSLLVLVVDDLNVNIQLKIRLSYLIIRK